MFKKTVIFSLLVFVCLTNINKLFAQGSIYSLKGQGILSYYPGSRATGMGGTTISLASAAHLNWINPASFSAQDYVRISGQYIYQNLNVQDNSNQFKTNYANFNGFIAAFPVYRGVGVSFGLQPVSKIDFQFETSGVTDDIDYTSSVKGLGGLNRLFLATGFKVHSKVRLGAGFGVIFGKYDETWRVVFQNSQFTNTYDQFRSNYSGLTTNLGAIVNIIPGWDVGGIFQSKHTINKKLDIKYFEPKISESDESELELPLLWGVGTSVHFKDRYLIALDYLYQDWESYSSGESQQPNEFTKRQRFSVGFEYGLPARLGMAFWKAIRYRAGFVYEKPYFLDYNNKSLSSYFVTAGLGVPFASGAGALDLAIEYGKRGDVSKNSFQESIMRFSLYVSGGELWFRR
jgi:hypothetical protein